MKTFDEWFAEKHGAEFDNFISCMQPFQAMGILCLELREYVTYAASALAEGKEGVRE